MSSFRQIEANRRNARLSTGPVTEDGKRQSRQNALRHGLTAETVIDALEDAEDYAAFEMTVTQAPVHHDTEIEAAIAMQARGPGGGLICLPDSFNTTHREVIIAAAARRGLPLIGTIEFPRAGGLMSYWFDTVERHAEAASYIDRILTGANPAELPSQQPTKFPLIINLMTANALGLTVRQACSISPTRSSNDPPYSAENMTCWPVSPRVGNVMNNDPSLIEAVLVQ